MAASAKEDRQGNIIRGVTGIDADVKVSLAMLEWAGFQDLKAAKLLKQGADQKGMFVVDAGDKETGFSVVTSTEGEGDEAKRVVTTQVNNHSEKKQYPTSSAAILFEGMKHVGLWEDVRKTESFRWIVEMMVRYTKDEDNASFPTRKNEAWEDFKSSDRTLHGLAFAMTADQIRDYLAEYVKSVEDRLKEQGRTLEDLTQEDFDYHYKQVVVGIPMHKDYLKKYGLSSERERKKDKTPLQSRLESRKESIEQAVTILERDEGELRKNGEVIDTIYGKYFVRIAKQPHEKLWAGFDAIKAKGYAGYISFDYIDPENPSYLVNTFVDKVDLSENPDLMALREKGGVMVRGTMFLKDRNHPELKDVTLNDLISAVTRENFVARGELAKFLDEEKANLERPMPELPMPDDNEIKKKGWDELFRRCRYETWKQIVQVKGGQAEEFFQENGNKAAVMAFDLAIEQVGGKKNMEKLLFKNRII